MKKTILFSGMVALFLFSCNKETTVDSKVDQNSLKEFFASLPNGDSNLINTLPIIDNSGFKIDALKKNDGLIASINRGNTIAAVELEVEDDLGAGPKVRFKWPGIDRYGNPCNKAIGVCVTIPLGAIESDVTAIGEDESGPNSVITIVGDKLIIEPTTDETGLTSDGYFPVADYMPISENLLIKPGIYKGSPEKIILDLIKVN